MIRVHISPWYDREDKADGGIRRVVEAMVQYFPSFGIMPVRNPDDADVIINHGGMRTARKGVPMIHIGHGLYWSRQPWGDNFKMVNKSVVESMKQSVAHTVPSEWVGKAVRRGGFFYPEVVYHGVNADEFTVKESHNGMVLWNKARADFVSDPGDLIKIASLMPGRMFQSTVGKDLKNKSIELPNVEIIGTVSYDEMKEIVSNAGVYLATARETFGIGTLEAMACGVPVAGWDWGGQSEIIKHGETGYLATPGDYKELANCIELCFIERERLSKNCRADIEARWTWEPRIKQYADIVKDVHSRYNERENLPKVSVIVTAYNLDKYLPDCISSVTSQTYSDYECILIDDAQSEQTKKIFFDHVKDGDKRFKYIPTPHNLGLVGSRNFGLLKSSGLYIRHLDADDFLSTHALEIESKALDDDPTIHIAYGHIESVREDGSRILDRNGEPIRSGWPEQEFNWYSQMSHLNQLPSCSMARREVYERSGGYRQRATRNEDAEFWCRVTSLGFVAKKVTQAVTYYHRHRENSKGATEWKDLGKEPDWTAWFPWRQGASEFGEAVKVMRKHGNSPVKPHIVPFGAQGPTPKDMLFWYVHDYAYPKVSIIVTCGPGHEHLIIDALDSIQAQTYPDWECIVVNDTGKPWDKNIMGAPWAKVVSTGGNKGASAARNTGFRYASADHIVWMDADDYWLPWFLEKMMSFALENDGVIYSDFIQDTGKELVLYRYAKDYDRRALLSGCAMPGSSVVIPRSVVHKITGWDEKIVGMEDWDFQIAIDSACGCAYHIEEPLFVYRLYSTTKREQDYTKINEIKSYISEKWRDYFSGGKNLMACGCKKKKIPAAAAATLTSSGNFSQETVSELDGQALPQMVSVEYLGVQESNFSIRSRVDRGVTYRFGNNPHHKIKTVYLQDALFLTSRTLLNGQPEYRIVNEKLSVPANDPVQFLGKAIA